MHLCPTINSGVVTLKFCPGGKAQCKNRECQALSNWTDFIWNNPNGSLEKRLYIMTKWDYPRNARLVQHMEVNIIHRPVE